MKKILLSVFKVLQLSIIAFAIVLTVFRLGVDNLAKLEPYVESWFEEQGITADVGHISARVEGFTSELYIAGLSIHDARHKPFLELQRATMKIDLWHSLLSQKLVLKEVKLYLQKAHLNLQHINQWLQVAQSKSATQNDNPAWLESMLALELISLEVEQIDLDRGQNPLHKIYKTRFQLSGTKAKKTLHISSALYQQKYTLLNSQINFDIASLLKKQQLIGQAYLALNLQGFERLNDHIDAGLSGDLTFHNWLEFDVKSSQSIEIQSVSDVVLQNVEFRSKKQNSVINAKMNLLSSYSNGQIKASLESQNSTINKQLLLPFSLDFNASLEDSQLNNSQLLISHTTLQDLAKIIAIKPLFKKQKRWLKLLNAKGEIEQILLHSPDIKQPNKTRFSVKAKNVQWQSTKGIPALNQIDISAAGNTKQITAQLKADKLDVKINQLFESNVQARDFSSSLNIYLDEDKTIIDAPNLKLKKDSSKAKGRLTLALEKQKSPFMYLRLQVNNADIETVRPFYPTKIMSEDVVMWLEKSLQKATIEQADVLYSGRLENETDFSKKQKGVFFTGLKILDLDLNYDPSWPILKAKKAQLLFHNHQLTATSDLATSESINVSDVIFKIDELSIPQATLSLVSGGDLSQQWAYLARTPIKDDIPYFAEINNFSGVAKARVKASFPIDNISTIQPKFDIKLKAKKAGFESQFLALNFSDINGDIHLTEELLTIKPLKAKWFGQDVDLKAKTLTNKNIKISMTSKSLEIDSLLNNLPEKFKQHASGKSSWDIDVVLATNADASPVMTVSARSKLVGTEIFLPNPMYKAKETSEGFKINLDLYQNNALDLNIHWNKRFKIKSHLQQDKHGAFEVVSANMAFGDASLVNSSKLGINISGQIDEINIDRWTHYFEQEKKAISQPATHFLANFNDIQLDVGQLQWQGIEAKDTHLNLVKAASGLTGTIDSSIAKGNIFIPILQPLNEPITLDMQFVDVQIKKNPKLKSNDSTLATNFIPNLDFKSDFFTINGLKFSDAQLQLQSHESNHFKVSSLSLTNNKITLNAAGNWEYDDVAKTHSSHLFIDFKGDNFGKTLSDLKYGEVIEKGDVNFTAELFWDTPFFELDFQLAQGKANMLLRDGFLKDVEPGSGRFVGLLSLSALPRRLLLDFSDIFKKGLEFDKIQGSFDIHDGSFWTQDLKMSGSSSDVKITGRTGVTAKDYDQQIVIIPQVRQTLPVLGSLVSGPAAGWALLLFQRLFKKPIDDSVTIKYKVTGSWDKPQIDLIEDPIIEDDVEEELDGAF